jgi:hypothetical protein
MTTHYFTSITTNYLPKARVLARSLRRHDPRGVVHLVLCDEPPAGFELSREPFHRLHLVGELGIPDLRRWLFKHDVVELCTAAKGPALVKLLAEPDAERVFFFDPDILVLHDLGELLRELDRASVLLTPHLTAPERDEEAIADNEISVLRHGIYNLGFLGVRPTDAGRRFARWWSERLLAHCYADIPSGLFTDQRWCDLAPALFEDVRILRDPRYNVATWNLSHRAVTRDDDGVYLVDGKPIVFFHFSGLDSGGHMMMLRKYAASGSPLYELHDGYQRALAADGQDELGKAPWAYGRYQNGMSIESAQRRVYRGRDDLAARFPDPFAVNGEPSLYGWFQAEPAVPTSSAADELKRTLTWRVGKMITGPVERVMQQVPGLVPKVKRFFRGRWR